MSDDNSDDCFDAPVTLSFKEQSMQRKKHEKNIRSTITSANVKAKRIRKDRISKRQTKNLYGEDKGEGQAMCEVMVENNSLNVSKKLANEFNLSETFDFRKYLPQDIRYSDNSFDSEDSEDEITEAILQGYADSDEGYHGSEEQELRNKILKKVSIPSKIVKHEKLLQNPKQRRPRGGRRHRKVAPKGPYVVALNRTKPIELARKRASEFIDFRLHTKGDRDCPKRTSVQMLASVKEKLQARRKYITKLKHF